MLRRHNGGASGGPAPPPPTIRSAVARFLLGSLAAVAVVVVGGFFALRSIAIDEAERDTRQQVQIEGRLVEAAGLGNGVLREDPAALEPIARLHPIQRLARPREIAQAALFLLSDRSSFMTGSPMIVDGGISVRLA